MEVFDYERHHAINPRKLFLNIRCAKPKRHFVAQGTVSPSNTALVPDSERDILLLAFMSFQVGGELDILAPTSLHTLPLPRCDHCCRVQIRT
jgi:hypothetical protein